MIFLLYLAFICIEAYVHYLIIHNGVDPTPDNKLITWSKVAVVGARILPAAALWYFMALPGTLEGILFFTACFLVHLTVFPVLLNILRGKPLHYLGNGLFDKILGLSPSFLFRMWCLGIMTAGAISAYYNTDLL